MTEKTIMNLEYDGIGLCNGTDGTPPATSAADDTTKTQLSFRSRPQ